MRGSIEEDDDLLRADFLVDLDVRGCSNDRTRADPEIRRDIASVHSAELDVLRVSFHVDKEQIRFDG